MKGLTSRNLAYIRREMLRDICKIEVHAGTEADTQDAWTVLDGAVPCRLFEGGGIVIAGQMVTQSYDGVLVVGAEQPALTQGKRYRATVQVIKGNLEAETVEPETKRTQALEIKQIDMIRDWGGNDIFQVCQVSNAR